jgi:hypothetical protein
MVNGFIQRLYAFFVVVFLFACSSANNKPLSIAFSADSTSIVFNGVDPVGLLQLQSESAGDSTLSALISVLQTPSERDSTLKELPIAGRVVVTDSNIVFIPTQPFVKGRGYLVITYLNARFGDAKDLVNGEVKPEVRPIQKLLTR